MISRNMVLLVHLLKYLYENNELEFLPKGLNSEIIQRIMFIKTLFYVFNDIFKFLEAVDFAFSKHKIVVTAIKIDKKHCKYYLYFRLFRQQNLMYMFFISLLRSFGLFFFVLMPILNNFYTFFLLFETKFKIWLSSQPPYRAIKMRTARGNICPVANQIAPFAKTGACHIIKGFILNILRC